MPGLLPAYGVSILSVVSYRPMQNNHVILSDYDRIDYRTGKKKEIPISIDGDTLSVDGEAWHRVLDKALFLAKVLQLAREEYHLKDDELRGNLDLQGARAYFSADRSTLLSIAAVSAEDSELIGERVNALCSVLEDIR